MFLCAIILLLSFNAPTYAQSNSNKALEITVDENGLIVGNVSEKEKMDAVSDVIENLKLFVSFFYGLAIATMALYFIMYFTKLGASGDNTKKRSMAMSGILYSGISLAMLGSIGVFAGIIYFLFAN